MFKNSVIARHVEKKSPNGVVTEVDPCMRATKSQPSYRRDGATLLFGCAETDLRRLNGGRVVHVERRR